MKQGVEAIAICFMHSYANDKHEKQAAEMIKQQLPGRYVTISSDLIPSARLYDRTEHDCT